MTKTMENVKEHRHEVPWVVVFFFGRMHRFMARRPLCALLTFSLAYLFWLLLVVILMKTKGDEFINMITDVPMYIRGNIVYTRMDAYLQAVDESGWEPWNTGEIEY